MKITSIMELDDVVVYLKKRAIIDQYKKAKNYILEWNLETVLFKKRQPKTSKVYQFRINHKYRAFWFFDEKREWVFKVIEISDHQDF